MKALQVVAPRTFTQVQTEKPDLISIGSSQLIIRPNWVSMCGSDIPFFTGSKRHITYPLPIAVPIHECVGQVVESTSNEFQPGDKVVSIPERDQGLAEFFLARPGKTVKLPAGFNDDGASCIIQPLSTVINALDRLGDISNKSIAVIGLGSIGLLFCWLLKKRGASQILGVDPLADRRQVAESLGASSTIEARSIELMHIVKADPRKWEPPDICIEAVGHQADTINDCLALVKQQGMVLAFGVPDQPVYPFEYELFFRKNLHLVAVVTPRWSEYLQQARDLYLSEQELLKRLVTHHFPIRDAPEAFTAYEQHADGILKAILDMSAW